MEKESSIVMLAESEMVTIPRMEYDRLFRRSTLLEVILEYSKEDSTWQLADAVKTVKEILSGGGRADA